MFVHSNCIFSDFHNAEATSAVVPRCPVHGNDGGKQSTGDSHIIHDGHVATVYIWMVCYTIKHWKTGLELSECQNFWYFESSKTRGNAVVHFSERLGFQPVLLIS